MSYSKHKMICIPDEVLPDWVRQADLLACRDLYLTNRAALYGYHLDRETDSWPEGITDRRPIERDGDFEGRIQCRSASGLWSYTYWNCLPEDMTWAHTTRWSPKTFKEQALEFLDFKIGGPETVTLGKREVDIIRKVLLEFQDNHHAP